MSTLQPDNELEFELQELYILCKHWMQDIAFIEDELHFFNNILRKYKTMGNLNEQPSRYQQFSSKIQELEGYIITLKKAVPEYLCVLKPFIGDIKKQMDIGMITKYNGLQTEIEMLFLTIKQLKSELFTYTEAIIEADKLNTL
jgi:hypothetical protein